jgi:branched-chain amino acid transport system ATP-binding protein
MGPNGSGKTTLFNVITGALVPDTGRVVLDGRSVAGLAAHRVCARGIARTFQLVRPFPGLSALDNVLVGLLYGRERGHAAPAQEAERLLALVGLAGKGRVPATALTLVDRKRLELARALATRPRVLLLDEFMAGLNPTETETAMALIRRLQGEGVTLLMVEHIVWALMDLAHRLVVLSAGEKIAEGAPRAVAADPTVIDVYLGTTGA